MAEEKKLEIQMRNEALFRAYKANRGESRLAQRLETHICETGGEPLFGGHLSVEVEDFLLALPEGEFRDPPPMDRVLGSSKSQAIASVGKKMGPDTTPEEAERGFGQLLACGAIEIHAGDGFFLAKMSDQTFFDITAE